MVQAAPSIARSSLRELAQRAVGVVLSPRATYAGVAARPRAAGLLALVLAVVASASFALFSTTVGQEALIDEQIRIVESIGGRVTDAQYDRLQAMAPAAPYLTSAALLVAVPVLSLAAAGLLWAFFNGLRGGKASFRQVFAVVVHSLVFIALQRLVSAPLEYINGSISSPTSLSALMPVLDETSFIARAAGSIDLFWTWMAISLAIGLAVLYKRRAGPIAAGLLGSYLVGALTIAALRTALSGA